MRTSRNVSRYVFGRGALDQLPALLAELGPVGNAAVFLVDDFFEHEGLVARLPIEDGDRLIFVDTSHEPTSDSVDGIVGDLRATCQATPRAVVGIGGGSTMDTAKAVSNLLTNGGCAADYQGWDLVRVAGVRKIGIPTLSGTGAESTRTCVLMNHAANLKLGMNSDFTVFDQLLLDPELTATVPRDQYFFSGMDSYIHCVESLAGSYRNAIADGLARESMSLCRNVFLSEDMMGEESREKMMVASYYGGCAVGQSYVGVVHPFSAGLSMVLGYRHCIANCIVMNAMEEFYPEEVDEFRAMLSMQRIDLPSGICADLSAEQFGDLYQAMIVHEKPLANALGEGFRDVLTPEKAEDVFRRM